MMRLPAWCVSALLIITAFGALASHYASGVRQGFDHRITYGFEHDAWSMAVAMSRTVFGMYEGYVGYRRIVKEASAVLAPDGVHNISSVDYLYSKDSIDEALSRVRAIDPATLPEFHEVNPDFVTIYAEDLGLADFYTLAFALFDYHAEAMYRLYFLLFGVSVALFAVQYRVRPEALLSLALLCVTFGVFFVSGFFNASVPSVNANRFASTLGFVPALHVLWSLFRRDRLTRGEAALLIAQALLFTFAFTIRKTAQWQVLLLIGVALVQAWPALRPLPRRVRWPVIRQILAIAPMRRLCVFLAVFVLCQVVQLFTLNSIYRSDCAIPHHMTWHSMYLGLSTHPDWQKYNEGAKDASGDGIAWGAFESEMKQRGENFVCSRTGLHKVRLHERVMRDLYLGFMLRHPVFYLEHHLYYKPKALLQQVRGLLEGVAAPFLAACGIMGFLAGCVGAAFGLKRRNIRRVLGITAAAFGLASLPMIAAYPAPFLLSDVMWMAVILGSVLAGACGWGLSQGVRHVRTRAIRHKEQS